MTDLELIIQPLPSPSGCAWMQLILKLVSEHAPIGDCKSLHLSSAFAKAAMSSA